LVAVFIAALPALLLVLVFRAVFWLLFERQGWM